MADPIKLEAANSTLGSMAEGTPAAQALATLPPGADPALAEKYKQYVNAEMRKGGNFYFDFGAFKDSYSKDPQRWDTYISQYGGPSTGGLSATGQGGQPDKLSSLFDEIYAGLKEPISLNDPYVQKVIQMSEKKARLSGIEGPLSLASTEAAAFGAREEREQQRLAGLSQLFGLGTSRESAQGQLGLERQRVLQDYLNKKAEQQQNLLSGLGAAGGGLLGGLVGSQVPGLGISGGIAAGTRGGAGLGGMFAPPPQYAGGGYKGGGL